MMMENSIQQIWDLALPYLQQGTMKDFVVHTQGVMNAMELLLEKEGGNKELMMVTAILHDVGWAKVPSELQRSKDNEDRRKALRLHIEYAPEIIREVLAKAGYKRLFIRAVTDIVVAHKFCNPRRFDKRLLIDADTLSDIFIEQFYTDARAYGVTPKQLLKFRKDNRFYTKTAEAVFKNEYLLRSKEIQ